MAGPSLGTLLIQRLDAMLGLTLSQQGQLVSRAEHQTVTQTAQAERVQGKHDGLVRHARESIDRAHTRQHTPAGATARHTGLPGSADSTSAPALHSSSTTTALGPTVRLILQLFAQQTQATPPLEGRSPLGLQYTAQRLQQSIQTSGLFYESHLHALARGAYRLQDIQREPQAYTRPSVSTQLPAHNGVDPSTHLLVRQQLEALAEQCIQWRGEAWPGVPLELRLLRDHAQEDTSDPRADKDHGWRSELTVHLPLLGRICIEVRLEQQQLWVLIKAPHTANKQMQEELEHLSKPLTALGLRADIRLVGLEPDPPTP